MRFRDPLAIACFATVCLFPIDLCAQERVMEFVGVNICIGFRGSTGQPHYDLQWNSPMTHSMHQVRSPAATHQFLYGEFGKIEIDENLVDLPGCANLPMDRISLNRDGQAEFCLSHIGEKYPVRVKFSAAARDHLSLATMLTVMHSMAACRVRDGLGRYGDGAVLWMGKEIPIHFPQ